MLKMIDVMIEKQAKRIEEGKGTKLDHAVVNWANKTWDKHPKIWKFIEDHKTGVDIAMDIAMTAALLNLGYQLGKANMLKAFNSGITDASAAFSLADEGKNLSVVSTCMHECGVKVVTEIKVNNSSDLLKVVNTATEALKNQGVDIHAI